MYVTPRSSLLVTVEPRTGKVAVDAARLHPALRRMTVGKRELYLMGHPIVDGRRSDAAVADAFSKAHDIAAFGRMLDGNFIVFVADSSDGSFCVISDRFASHPFYWTQTNGGGLAGSSFLPQLVSHLGPVQWNETSLVEFLHFRRVFGEKTHDNRCAFLASASILSVRPTGLSLQRYWQPDYGARRHDVCSGAEAIAAGLRRTMRMHMEDVRDENRSYGLFLSGGLDSRALLAAAQDKLACVTTCSAYNNEAAVAQECAGVAGAAFSFVPRPARPYDEHVGDAVFYGGGQHIVTEGHFFDYERLLDPRDCWFLGLGLDVFFGGLYLPKNPVRWLGRDALHERLLPIQDDIVGMFMDRVKYRLRTSDPWQVVRPQQRARLRDGLRHSIGEIADRGRALGAAGYDLWEHFHLHNFGRHYSFLMIQSVRYWGECRVPALCNDLLDAAIALPAEQKVNSQAYLAAMRNLSLELMRVRNANTNVAAGRSLFEQSAIRAGRILLNRMGGNFRVSPEAVERSWPTARQTITNSPVLRNAIAALPDSESLDATGIIDLDAVRQHVDDHVNGRRDHGILLLILATLAEASQQMHAGKVQ